MIYREVNFDGLIGPTHNYGGLSFGNIASQVNSNTVSSPRFAALQGLKKMKFLMDQGLVQAVLPPHLRPHISFLMSLGFRGTSQEILREVARTDHLLINQCSSASSMWVANAATVTSSIDSLDNKVHLTPANLISHQHRSIECGFNYLLFNRIFNNEKYFSIEKPLPCLENYSDEGAANYIRLAPEHSNSGLNIFVYGKSLDKTFVGKYPARQSREACEAIFRKHLIKDSFYMEQSLQSINAGVFHNDVISVGNENVLFYHERAFEDADVIDSLIKRYREKFKSDLILISVTESELSLKEAVRSYLFNSQLITLNKNEMLLLAPYECKSYLVAPIIDRILEDNNPIQKVEYFQLKESMKNGGGPACLRLRILLNEDELEAMHQGIILTASLYDRLIDWVNKHYREELTPGDLIDPILFEESYAALNELANILELGSIYDLN